MKTEEIKQRYDAFPARVKDENAKITALAKGLTALNKTHASNIAFLRFSYRQRTRDSGTNDSNQLDRFNQRVVTEL